VLTLTRKSGYALIALAHLAQDAGACCSAREIARRYRIPLSLLMNLLKLLTHRGLARSVRGPRGGYTLAAPPSEITLTNIIEAVEGPIHLARCVARGDEKGPVGGKEGCELMSCCPARPSVYRVHQRLIQFLDELTLAQIAGDPGPSPGDPLEDCPGKVTGAREERQT